MGKLTRSDTFSSPTDRLKHTQVSCLPQLTPLTNTTGLSEGSGPSQATAPTARQQSAVHCSQRAFPRSSVLHRLPPGRRCIRVFCLSLPLSPPLVCTACTHAGTPRPRHPLPQCLTAHTNTHVGYALPAPHQALPSQGARHNHGQHCSARQRVVRGAPRADGAPRPNSCPVDQCMHVHPWCNGADTVCMAGLAMFRCLPVGSQQRPPTIRSVPWVRVVSTTHSTELVVKSSCAHRSQSSQTQGCPDSQAGLMHHASWQATAGCSACTAVADRSRPPCNGSCPAGLRQMCQ